MPSLRKVNHEKRKKHLLLAGWIAGWLSVRLLCSSSSPSWRERTDNNATCCCCCMHHNRPTNTTTTTTIFHSSTYFNTLRIETLNWNWNVVRRFFVRSFLICFVVVQHIKRTFFLACCVDLFLLRLYSMRPKIITTTTIQILRVHNAAVRPVCAAVTFGIRKIQFWLVCLSRWWLVEVLVFVCVCRFVSQSARLSVFIFNFLLLSKMPHVDLVDCCTPSYSMTLFSLSSLSLFVLGAEMSLSCMRFFVFVIFLYRFLTGGVYFSPYDQQTVFLKIMMSLNMKERGRRSRGMFEVPLFGRVVLFVFFFSGGRFVF